MAKDTDTKSGLFDGSFVTLSKDGVEVPAEGMPFTVWDGPPEKEDRKATTLVLHDLLAGLNVIQHEGRQQSQAQTFASFAVQRGFTSEATIIEAFPQFAPTLGSDGKIFCNSYNLITRWEAEIKRERARKAKVTMQAKGLRLDESNMLPLMKAMLPDLIEGEWVDLVKEFKSLITADEDIAGPLGAQASSWITRAKTALAMTHPEKNWGAQRPASRNTTDTVHSDTPVVVNPAGGNAEEPF